jgi:hypothetical protein
MIYLAAIKYAVESMTHTYDVHSTRQLSSFPLLARSEPELGCEVRHRYGELLEGSDPIVR